MKISTQNGHGYFEGDAFLVDYLTWHFRNADVSEIQSELCKYAGMKAGNYSDVESRSELVVMLADVKYLEGYAHAFGEEEMNRPFRFTSVRVSEKFND